MAKKLWSVFTYDMDPVILLAAPMWSDTIYLRAGRGTRKSQRIEDLSCR